MQDLEFSMAFETFNPGMQKLPPATQEDKEEKKVLDYIRKLKIEHAELKPSLNEPRVLSPTTKHQTGRSQIFEEETLPMSNRAKRSATDYTEQPASHHQAASSSHSFLFRKKQDEKSAADAVEKFIVDNQLVKARLVTKKHNNRYSIERIQVDDFEVKTDVGFNFDKQASAIPCPSLNQSNECGYGRKETEEEDKILSPHRVIEKVKIPGAISPKMLKKSPTAIKISPPPKSSPPKVNKVKKADETSFMFRSPKKAKEQEIT